MAVPGEPIATIHPLKIFDAARQNKKYVYACAPMVRYSKLAFRQVVHHYGTDLVWTPMILAKEFNRSEFARDSDLTVSSRQGQPPTILQFGANSPLELARASSLAAPYVSGVDLNCGCPQSWACAETLGAALMNKRELVRDMVVETRNRLRDDGWAVGFEKDMESPLGRSVSVKIRVHDDLRRTVDFLQTVIADRLVDWVTIHPRTRHTPSSTPIRVEALDFLVDKYKDRVPILLSGDIFDLAELPVEKTPDEGLAGFMSARGLLANPALFAGYPSCPWEAVERLMCSLARAPVPFKLALHHVQQMVAPGMGTDKNALLSKKERAALNAVHSMVGLIDYLDGVFVDKLGREMRRDF